MPISDDDISALLAALDAGRQEWISGRFGSAGDGTISQDTAMTLYGPFGGEVVRAGPELRDRQARATSRFAGGTGATEVLNVITADDLAVVVSLERSTVRFEGRDEPHPWVLRVTEVCRRSADGWVRLHRHADPLLGRRSLEEVLALLPAQ